MKYFLPVVFILGAVLLVKVDSKLEEKFVWKELEFKWPSKADKEEALKSEKYIPKNNLPLGLEVWKDKLFITIPRWKSGVAASLNYVSNLKGGSPALIPYPSWEANELPSNEKPSTSTQSNANLETRVAELSVEGTDKQLTDNSSIISTFRIRADECDRLWVMDTGLADILGEGVQHAAPSLVIFDLNTDKLIRRYYFPRSQLKEDTFFANVIVDTERGDCDNAFAYAPDLGGYGVVVYSFKEDKSWRVKHNFFHFDPLHGNYNVGGVNFQWTDGVFGMAVGNKQKDGSRPVYFHAFSSTKEFVVPNTVLQNETFAQSTDSYYNYSLLGDRGPNSQSSASFYDLDTNVLFYTQVNKDAIWCWNSARNYTENNLGMVDSDSNTLVFPNDLKVDNNGTIWVLSDKMPVFLYKELNPKEDNYRILTGKTMDVIRGTPCSA